MLHGEMETDEIVSVLTEVEANGVGAEELGIGVEVMRAHMVKVEVPEGAIDIVGTGGTGLKTLSISTATALVVAGCGVPVAKHGNRGASSPTGTADTLSELGVNIAMSPERASAAVGEVGMGFLFAPTYHPALRHVGLARKQIGSRTLFNRLGPLCNPGEVDFMLVGSAERGLVPAMAEALRPHVKRALVVSGHDGLDEITTTGATETRAVGFDHPGVVEPEMFGVERTAPFNLTGGPPAFNAAALRALLDGVRGPYRDIVVVNATAALSVVEPELSVEDAKAKAEESLDSGVALSILKRLAEFSHG